MAAIVTGKKCDKLLGVGVGGAERQVGLPARLQRKTAIFALKVAKTARKSRNSSERRERMHCFLKGRILPPGCQTAERKAIEEKTASCFAVGSVSSSKMHPG